MWTFLGQVAGSLYLYMHTHMYTYTRIYIYIYIHIYIYIPIPIYIYIHTDILYVLYYMILWRVMATNIFWDVDRKTQDASSLVLDFCGQTFVGHQWVLPKGRDSRGQGSTCRRWGQHNQKMSGCQSAVVWPLEKSLKSYPAWLWLTVRHGKIHHF